ncbi:hypothetical protein BUALT_Bualt13G0084000 [Buddleja alternifolia]|uniref:Uncharacterized protein n=1 Tax=Buddleja alternifolia TaxID=168488 RepID=A0AAV6WUU6_9LAMI|nr:hypothetical protein BUALT_Bualt13G0084000 [Buddleja alternifolia]
MLTSTSGRNLTSSSQLYLRSYTFSREEDYKHEKTIKCLGRAGKDNKATSDKAGGSRKRRKSGGGDGGRSKCDGLRRAKAASCSAFEFIFRRLLSCTTKIDVVN